MTPLIVTDLKKIYKNNRGVESASFSIEQGDIYGLLGANGAGKTTAMKVITGLIPDFEGEVFVFGNSIRSRYEEAAAYMGSLIEMPSFYGHMSAEQNLKIAAKYYLEQNITTEEIHETLRSVKLYEYRKDKVGKFSLGMKQRMGLGLALIGRPGLFILDEPANGLDIDGIVEIRTIIQDLAREKGASFLVSSHQAAELQKLCNKVGILYNGRLQETRTMDYVLENYPSLEDFYLHCTRGGTA